MIQIQPRRVLQALFVVNCLLVGGFIFFRYVPLSLRSITRLFDVTAEASVPAWYSAMLLAGIGLIACVRGLDLWSASRATGWSLHLALGAGFLFLSPDEVGQIHESISGGLHKHLDDSTSRDDDASAWDKVTFGIYFTLATTVLLIFAQQAIDLFLRSPGRWSILAGGVLFATGAVVIDEFQAAVPFRLGAALEDGCELFGATLMLHGFLLNLGTVTVSTRATLGCATAPRAVTTAAVGFSRRIAPAPAGDIDYDDEIALHGS